MKTVSPNVQQDLNSLHPKQFITFLQITIETDSAPVNFYLTDGETRTWKSISWSNAPFYISGISATGSGERSRPKVTIPNDGGTFTYYVSKRYIEGATVTRYLVHPDDLASGVALESVFYIAQISSLSGLSITAELRSPSDGNNFVLPSRRYVQPEFPSVSL
jgi:phage-related protein